MITCSDGSKAVPVRVLNAAQDVNQSNPGTTAWGPRTVDVSTASGIITLDYGTVTAANP